MTRMGGKNYYPYFIDQKQKGRIVMLEKVIIIICIAVCLGNKDFNAMNGEYENYFCKKISIKNKIERNAKQLKRTFCG